MADETAAVAPTLEERRRLFVEGLGVRAALVGLFAAVMIGLAIGGVVDPGNARAAIVILLTLVLINVPYWFLGRRKRFPTRHFVAHWAVDIVLLTAMIHFIGGIDAPYSALAYSPLVLFSAVNESRVVAMRLAGLSLASFTLLMILEGTGILPKATGMWAHHYTIPAQVVAFTTPFSFVFALAWIGGTLADQLKAANASLREFAGRIEEQNRTLERKVAERTAELARATQEVEDLVHIVSHDLKNVAVAVTETARKLVARESPNLSERGRAYASNLLEDGRTMSRMLEDLLLLFRQTDAVGTRREWVDVGAVVRQTLRQLQYQIEAKQIEVAVKPLPSVFAETQKIRHIFDNLLHNACKYVGDKNPARIEVGGSAEDSSVTFFVRDNGIGLEDRQRERVFQLYHRAPSQDVAGREQEGHGVGLAIVKRIVERYGGRIVVESAPREGTTFRVTLPRGEEPRG